MSKHTPGPWAVESVMSEANHDIVLDYQIPGAGHPIMIASVYGSDEKPLRPGDISNHEAQANARLIAAAPELLAALKEITSYYQDPMPVGSSGERMIEAARIAIAKAESQ